MNRVDSKRHPNTICDVIKERKQFSFLWDDVDDIIKYDTAWNKSVKAMMTVITVSKNHRSTQSCHYAHTLITNYWTVDYVGKVHGNHVFYDGGC